MTKPTGAIPMGGGLSAKRMVPSPRLKIAVLIYRHPMHGDSGMRRLNLDDPGMHELLQHIFEYGDLRRMRTAEAEALAKQNYAMANAQFTTVTQQVNASHAQQQAAFQSHVRQANIERAISHGEKQSPLIKKIKELRDGLMGTSKRGKTGLIPIDTRLGEKSAPNIPNWPSK